MIKIAINEASQQFEKLVEQVQQKNEPVVVTGPSGDMVRIIPVPKPVSHWKGRPVYRLQDVQYLDAPWWFD